MHPHLSYKIISLGDAALTIDFSNLIDESINKKVITLFHNLQHKPIQGMVEAVPAYSSLTIYYDVISLYKNIPDGKTVFEWMKDQTEKFLKEKLGIENKEEATIIIPVCYDREFATDIDHLADKKDISPEEIIHLHTSKLYRVYMLGFLPGFTYMGEVDDKISIPRKPTPQNVIAGSVGIAGKQTGVYPLNSPGGWQIIGRTPLKIFDKEKKEPTLIKAGDQVRFISIGKDEFENIKSRNS